TPLMERVQQSLAPQLPLEIDEETRLDEVDVLQGESTLRYRHTLTEVDASALDVNRLKGELQKVVTMRSCLDPLLRPILDNGGQLRFVYRDRRQQPFLQIDVAEDACG
ncbi:MAG: hypothetical protein AAGA56_30415, partial [Myxococcota bacterium]